jgi:polysaccharide biosynthesis/export protein
MGVWRLLLCASSLEMAACGVSGSFIWVKDAPNEFFSVQTETILSLGDVLNVRVFGQEALSTREKVRRDGAITLPLIGEVRVAGRVPSEVSKEIEARLKPFVNDPHVTVVVEESHTRVTVLGELGHSGVIELDGPQGMYEALALAGGLSQFASETKIFVLRSGPKGTYRIRFDYGEITRQEGRAAAFRLQNGDKIFVE